MCLAVPGEILSITGDDPISRTAKVSFGGTIREVNLACVPDCRIGDYVLVHVGMALSIVDPVEAEEIFRYLSEMDRLAGASEREE